MGKTRKAKKSNGFLDNDLDFIEENFIGESVFINEGKKVTASVEKPESEILGPEDESNLFDSYYDDEVDPDEDFDFFDGLAVIYHDDDFFEDAEDVDLTDLDYPDGIPEDDTL